MLRSPFVDPCSAMLDAAMPLTQEDYEEWGDPRADASVWQADRRPEITTVMHIDELLQSKDHVIDGP